MTNFFRGSVFYTTLRYVTLEFIDIHVTSESSDNITFEKRDIRWHHLGIMRYDLELLSEII